MLLFLLMLLPLALITYCLYARDRKILFPAAAGCFSAVIVCACRFFFSYEHRLVYDSFSENFLYSLLKQNLLPLVIVTAIFALVSRDTIEYKVKNFFPTLCSFFAVYLPYCVIAGTEYYYLPYDLFFKPVIYLAMLIQISLCIINAWKAFTEKKIAFAVIDILIILIYMIYPAVSDALYAIDQAFVIILIIGILYSFIPFGLLAIKQIRNR